MSLLILLLLPFAGSLCAAVLPRSARNGAVWLSGSIALACAALAASALPRIAAGEVVRLSLPWAPTLGLHLQLRADGFAGLFALLVSVMGVLVVLYTRYYMSAADPVPRFFAFLLAFMGSMLGVVLSGNLIQLVVFWELTSLTSFMLIAYWYHREDARRGARMALVVTASGGFCLLLGMLLLGDIVGSYDLDAVLAAGDVVRADPRYATLLILVLLGVFTKSAQFPFHFWLPQAMAAPTPVSAYLHSATMVKAGVFLLARLWPTLHGTELWFWLVSGAGAATLLIGAFSATFQRDLKGVLAYSTISHLGLITLLLGMNSELALIAGVFHMMNHATFKASLFMAAGIVDHEAGTRDLRRLSGLGRLMPLTATVATVAAAAMAGVPLLNGFLSKEMFFAETIVAGDQSGLRYTLPAIATLAGAFSVAYSLRFIHQVFFGPVATDLPRSAHEPTRGMIAPAAVLVLLSVLVGTMPATFVGPLLALAAHSILGPTLPAYELAVWHGFTLPLLMSLIALVGGTAFYLFLRRSGQEMDDTPLLSRINAARLFDRVNVAVIRFAGELSRRLFPAGLQKQLLLVVAIALIAGALPVLRADAMPPLRFGALDPLFALLWAGGAACAIAAAQQAKFHRLAALILVGGVGLVTSLTFAWHSAPDLALTQVSVEAVTLVLILLGLRWLPKRIAAESMGRRLARVRARHVRDLALAMSAGSGLSVLCYAVLTRSGTGELAPFFLSNALEQGGGLNVVNVMLVDFRGFDTLGEITVVGTVAITVYALLRRFRPAPESMDARQVRSGPDTEQAALDDIDLALPRGELRVQAVLVRLLLPVMAIVSVYFLLRGHNAPGGGFVGGLVLATGLIAQYMIGGTIWVESRLRIHPLAMIGAGLLAAAGAGMTAWASGLPFLSARDTHLALPLIGDVHLSTVLLFDLGVYALVVGATLLILVALAHQSLRRPRMAEVG